MGSTGIGGLAVLTYSAGRGELVKEFGEILPLAGFQVSSEDAMIDRHLQ
jgi:hypothetical protein